MVEMSKHSMRIGRLSRFSASRSSSSASTRRSRFCSEATAVGLEREPRVLLGQLSSRRFSPRSGARTSTREPRRSDRNSASADVSPAPRGTTICGGTLGDEP